MIPIARPLIGSEERAAVDAVLRSGGLAQGPEVAAFESEFATIVGDRHCIAVNSGTSALHLGLLAAGIGAGDEVIVPSFTFAATANAVRLAGAEAVFVDIDPETYCMDPEAAAAAIGPRTAAIMPVHLYGHPAAMVELNALAERHGLLVVEDAAQAHAAALGDRPVGTFGRIAAFSFYPTKNMTTGEGGMIVTDDGDIARQARLLRNQGMEERYRNEVVGFNTRLTDMAAAIGRVQLAKLPAWTKTRRANAAQLSAGLSGVVSTPTVRAGAEHVYHQYTVRCPDRDRVVSELPERGVGAAVYYPVPVHRLPSFTQAYDLPATEQAAREVLSLPVGPHLGDGDVERIIEVVTAVVAG